MWFIKWYWSKGSDTWSCCLILPFDSSTTDFPLAPGLVLLYNMTSALSGLVRHDILKLSYILTLLKENWDGDPNGFDMKANVPRREDSQCCDINKFKLATLDYLFIQKFFSNFRVKNFEFKNNKIFSSDWNIELWLATSIWMIDLGFRLRTSGIWSHDIDWYSHPRWLQYFSTYFLK